MLTNRKTQYRHKVTSPPKESRNLMKPPKSGQRQKSRAEWEPRDERLPRGPSERPGAPEGEKKPGRAGLEGVRRVYPR